MQYMNVQGFEWGMMIAVLIVAIAALVYAWMLARQILGYDRGSEKMQQTWRDIKTGANAYLRTQLGTIWWLVAILTVHLRHGFFAPEGFEFPLTLLAACLALVLLGAGPASVDGFRRKGTASVGDGTWGP